MKQLASGLATQAVGSTVSLDTAAAAAVEVVADVHRPEAVEDAETVEDAEAVEEGGAEGRWHSL